MKFCWKTILIFGLLWILVVGAGMFVMLVYETTPGVAAAPPVDWPSQSPIPLPQNQAVLVMFAHPQCPCTKASIGELSLLMTHCQGKVKAYVFMVKPKGEPDGWEKSDVWKAAAEIPGVTVRTDDEGVEARRFDAKTSGQTFLYDEKGRLLFKGGITASRGHSGDNDGRSAIVSILNDGKAERKETLVFGCSLFDQAEDKPFLDEGKKSSNE